MSDLVKKTAPNWKTPAFVIGGTVGLLAGLASAYFYTRSAEENNAGDPPTRISTGDVFKLGLATVALMRQISDLGVDRERNKGRR